MRSLRQVGLASAGVLTSEEIQYIETRIVETVRPQLIGRTLMPAIPLAHAGFKKYTYYTQKDMSQALISMLGEEESQDRVELAEGSVKIPIISKGYNLHWRDVLGAREGGRDLNTQHAENAARQVAEEEDKLILQGEVAGVGAWNAYGIEGLITATGNLGASGGAWPTNCVANVVTAKQALRAVGHYGPYALILPSAIYGYLEELISNTEKWYFQAIGELIGGVENIKVSDNFYASDGAAKDSAMLISMEPGNFELIVGSDLQNHTYPLKSKNLYGEVWEAVVPVIKRPKAIYEIDTIISG